jgi:dTDP-4-amino-4,6-dideoxygalactose transaminase
VVFADVDATTGNLDPVSVRETLKNTKVAVVAIAPVHLGGRPCDMVALREIADEFGCALVEDACHAPGAYYLDAGGQAYPAGGACHSEVACFSFHAVKHIAMAEGGAVATRRSDLFERMQLYRSHGMSRDADVWRDAPEPDAPWYYEMAEVGYNYRLTDVQSALGLSQLSRLNESLQSRRRIAKIYDQLLAEVPNVQTPRPVQNENGHAWHLYQLAIDFDAIGKSRGQVMRELAARGIGTQVHYIPLYRQPYYRDQGLRTLAQAEAFYRRTLSIPMYPELSDADQREIVAAIKDVLSK